MKSEVEDQPFLDSYYSDDLPGSGSGPGSDYHHSSSSSSSCPQRAARKNRLGRDLLIFLLASLLWLALLAIILPWWWAPPTTTTAAAAAASTTTTTTTITTTTPPGIPIPHGGVNAHQGGKEVGGGGGVKEDLSRVHNITSGSKFVSCGNSTTAARRAACRYDTLLNHWVPAQCVDQEWIEEYQDDGSWTAFADVNLTQRLTPEEMGERDHYYTSIRDHVNHCAMLWRKQFWTLFEARRVFDAVIVNSYHTEHCAEFLSNLMNMDRTEPTLVRVGFSGCWIREDGAEL